MRAARHYATPVQDGTVVRCWRNTPPWSNRTGLCPNRGTGPAGLCDVHRAEMRAWSTSPAPRRHVDGRPAVARWLDDLERDLDQAIRSAA